MIQNESFDNLGLELQIMEKELIGLLISSSYPQVTIKNSRKVIKEKTKTINNKSKNKRSIK